MTVQLSKSRLLLLGSVGMMAAGTAGEQSEAGPVTAPGSLLQTMPDCVSQ